MADFTSVLQKNNVLRIGEVISVEGRRISIRVDKNKNLSDLFFNGELIRNISVNSFIEIRKGFLNIIGKVDGEKIQEDFNTGSTIDKNDKNYRILSVSLTGYIDEDGIFIGGTKELPLIGNEAFILTPEKIHKIHNIAPEKSGDLIIQIASSEQDDVQINFPIDGLFNSHIAIFGNTGSGKSNTLAALYQNLFCQLNTKNSKNFNEKCHFVLFDFNGEYTTNWFQNNTKILNLSTQNNESDKIQIKTKDLLDIETFSILVEATEKTQKPFLKRAIKTYNQIVSSEDGNQYIKDELMKRTKEMFSMTDKDKAFLVRDYLKEILPPTELNPESQDWTEELDWHSRNYFFYRGDQNYNQILNTQNRRPIIYNEIESFSLSNNHIHDFIIALYLQLIKDIFANRANNEHIAPVINRLKSRQKDITKVLEIKDDADFWSNNNFIVINLNNVNLDIKKILPLLLAKKLYNEHKNYNNTKSLSIIIDEAHNILSTESTREAETWKDYRLETFNEIIKEGRKFGVFMTISSQRPSDISPTIISQAHNYFIHRLINQDDLKAIAKSISYIDKISEESIPTLPVGTCIFSGIATQMPLKICVTELPKESQPKSNTIKFADLIS